MKVNRYTIWIKDNHQEEFLAWVRDNNDLAGAVVDYDWEDSYESE